jgi:hypothetical protein
MARGRQGAPARAKKEVTGLVTDAAGLCWGSVTLASKSFEALTMTFRSERNDEPARGAG